MRAYDRLYHLAREIDERYLRVVAAVAEANESRVRRELPGGAGAVVVTGDGRLVAVELDTRDMPYRYSTGARLAADLLTAIRAAEIEAAEQWERHVAAVQWPDQEG